MVCLLVTVGILCICTPVKVQASERHLTGDTEVSTVINPAGTATTPEEVGQLNTANTVSITYNNGNGQINGASDSDHSDADRTGTDHYYHDDLFYEDHHRAAFYQVCTEYPDGTAEPDPDRTGTDPDIFHYGAYDHEDQ